MFGRKFSRNGQDLRLKPGFDLLEGSSTGSKIGQEAEAPYIRSVPTRKATLDAWGSLDNQTKTQLKLYLQGEVEWTYLIGLRGKGAKSALKVLQVVRPSLLVV